MSTTSATPLTNALLNKGLSPSPAASSTSSALGKDDFLKLLVAQMKNQDPMAPTDNTAFVTQLAQFSQLDNSQQLNQNISDMLLLQGLTQGTNLIGKTVTYLPTDSDKTGK